MNKLLKIVLYFFLGVILLFSAFAVFSGRTYLFKAVLYNYADVDDYKKFTNVVVEKGAEKPWPLSKESVSVQLPGELIQLLESTETTALAIIKNDSLLLHRYWSGYSDSSYSGSFSIAKSITSLLIGIAVKEGLIKSIEEPVGNYLPEFKEGLKAEVRIVDLLTMSSGTNWDESYSNPLSVTTEIYYGTDAYKTATSVKMVRKPGKLHIYKSGDTELLGLILEKATGKKLGVYASEKLWKPLGASHTALWSLDREEGNTKSYCCFNSNAPDFARLGVLMLHKGNWFGNQLVDSAYCTVSTTPCLIPDESGKPCNYYGYQWWILPDDQEVFMARGILGQFIIVIPSKKMVIVRLGKTVGERAQDGFPVFVHRLVDWAKQ